MKKFAIYAEAIRGNATSVRSWHVSAIDENEARTNALKELGDLGYDLIIYIKIQQYDDED